MNKEEIKVMIKDGVYSEDGITYMSDKQYNNYINIIEQLQQENKQLKENWNKLKKELKDKFEEYRYVEDECLRIMAQEDDSILFSMSCIEKSDSNE